ncbi:MAG: hypothetical protein GY750_08610 [Lentisphaerae bacterium]|nr:hypothetical protein [Lentisphaerota bacterium]MCP4101471.1 hypothetical protein [Lentisphaerota bacterium]
MIVTNFETYSSAYLNKAYKDEEYMIKHMEIADDQKSFEAIIDIKNHNVDTTGKFHLSVTMASIIVQQLGVIYAFASENEAKDREIYYLKESWRYKRQVANPSDILFRFRDIKPRRSKIGVSFECSVDISDGAFAGQCKILKPIA